MRTLRMAELKGAWLAWAAVGLTFVATSFAIAITILMMRTAQDGIAAGLIPEEHGQALEIGPSFSLAIAALAALSVVGASTGLVVQARRAALARLALAGATPRQVVRLVLWQLAAVATAGAVIGDLLALALLQPAIGMEYRGRGVEPIAASYDIGSVLLATVVAVGLALLGGWRQARVASRVPAVEALRTKDVTDAERRRLGRYLLSALLLVVSLGMAAAVVAIAPEFGRDGGDIVMQVAVVALLLLGTALALAGPVTVGLLTRAWTALVPVRAAAWQLARGTVVAKSERLARTVTPVMFTIGMLVGISTIGAGVSRALQAQGDVGLENSGIVTLIGFLGHPLIISIAGGVGAVIMMSRQREAELALAGVAGATPRQQVATVVLEGVIITVTATILGVVMAAVGVITMYVGADRLGLPGALAVDPGALIVLVAICGAITVAATTLPVLASLRRPAPAVVAQLVAE